MTRATLEKEQMQVAAMFDSIAPRYDLTNDVLTLWQTKIWRSALRHAVAAKPGVKVLDVAAGTGSSSVMFAQDGAEVVPCDISSGMVEQGRLRHPQLPFMVADAMNLPFADNSFDVTAISFGLRNVPDPVRAIEEMYRVAKPGGKVVICEFSHPANIYLEKVYDCFLERVLPAVANVSSGVKEAYEYLVESILEWPNQYELANLMREAGWEQIEFRNISFGIVALHRGRKMSS